MILFIGIASADSQSLLIPLLLVMAGGLLTLGGERRARKD